MNDHPLTPACRAIASLTPEQLLDIIEGYVDSPDVCALIDDLEAYAQHVELERAVANCDQAAAEKILDRGC